jgi:hypothetical protein
MTPTKPPDPPATQTVIGFTKLDETIAFLEAGAEWAQLMPVPGAAGIALISEKILQLIGTAIRTHEAVTKEPLDLTKLHQLPHV